MSSSCQVYYSENPSKVLSVSSYAKSKDEAHSGRKGGNSPTAPMPAPPPGLLLHILPRLMTFLNPDVSQQAKREGMRESHSFFFFPPLLGHLPFLCSSLISFAKV